MNTVIVTPLFPPDTSAAARYTKELAGRLPDTSLSVIAYGTLPESVSGVEVYPVSKRQSKIARATTCVRQLFHLQPHIILLQNGPSTELPILLYSYMQKTKIIYITSDHGAVQTTGRFGKWLRARILKRVAKHVTPPANAATYLPIEWLPFIQPNKSLLEQQEKWWSEHITKLTKI